MTTCENCGAPTAWGEDFCGACGAYLSWEDRPRQPEPTAAPAPVEPATPRAPTVPAAHAVPPRPTVPPAVPAVAPTAGPVQPGAPVPALPGPAAPPIEPPEPPAPGELICGQCGSGNVPIRRFCRRCGASLTDAPVAVRPPWWRRLSGPRRPGRAAPAAGERLRRRVWRRPRFVLPLLVLVLLLGGGYLARAQLSAGVEAVRDRIADPQQIHPTAVRASSEQPGHQAALAVDGTNDRSWSPAGEGDARGEYLEVELPSPVRLVDLVLHSGVSANAEQFLTQARPRALTVTLTAPGGGVTTRTLQLADAPGPQRFRLAVSGVQRLRLTVDGAYGTGPGRRVALAEAEFFRRP
ncbi:NADase-type glycan-binding domain-containing protein [Kitasatospora sp. NPDC001664]